MCASIRLSTIEFVRRHLSILLGTELAGRLIVITEAGMRIRSGPGLR
jgi:hypothetical protein